jgi:glycosyltransferase involved in cell wall biosynthesis
MKILIAVPTFESIKPECFKSIYGLKIPDRCTLYFDYVSGYDCAKARNQIAKNAMAGNYDYVLMVDSDIQLPKDTLIKLLECESDIALGWYYRKRTKTDQTVIYTFGKDFNDDNCIKGRTMIHEIPRPIEVKGGGLGIALIKVNIFEKLQYPYFKFVTYPNDAVLSEDLYFCNLASGNGCDIKCNPSVKGNHIFEILM